MLIGLLASCGGESANMTADDAAIEAEANRIEMQTGAAAQATADALIANAAEPDEALTNAAGTAAP